MHALLFGVTMGKDIYKKGCILDVLLLLVYRRRLVHFLIVVEMFSDISDDGERSKSMTVMEKLRGRVLP